MAPQTPRISIVMRSRNDIDTIEETLSALERQTIRDYELWNHDSESSDGTLSVIRRFNCDQRILQNSPGTYIPGQVLNHAVSLCRGEIIVFLNSDATPLNDRWLETLIAPLADPGVGAVYGRQTARADCYSLFEKDTERAFGDGHVAANWRHFFSMANSAVRRSVALAYPFSNSLKYSEDIEWSYRLKHTGLRIQYVPEAAACHSHNYTLAQSYQRHRGEGAAEAAIFTQREINYSFLKYALLPLGAEVVRDLSWSLKRRSLPAMLHSIPLRLAQKWGRWAGARATLSTHGRA